MGKLSIVATPIGNLEDMTLRALRTLKEVDLILCEDTRVTKKLLSHFAIKTPTLSYHAHSGDAKAEKVLFMLEEGRHIALVTDAGTPGVSDPGGELVSLVRERFGEEVQIEAIPGPSSLSAALSIAGLKSQQFVFYAFLPHKKGRETALRTIAEEKRASVFFESTHRIIKAIESLAKLIPERRIAVCKEITKTFEAVFVGTPAEVLEKLSAPGKSKGEFVVVIEED